MGWSISTYHSPPICDKQIINQNKSYLYHALHVTVSDSATTTEAYPCSSISFLDHGLQSRGKGIYRSFPETDVGSCTNVCDNEQLCRDFTLENGNCRLSASDLTSQVLTFEQCQISCMNDGNCSGYTYNSDNQRCRLSNDPAFITDSSCLSCKFYEKKCQSCTY